MKKLSELIYEKEFEKSKSSGFLRSDMGYDPTHVDLFLDDIGPIAEKLEKEIEELKEKNRQYEIELNQVRENSNRNIQSDETIVQEDPIKKLETIESFEEANVMEDEIFKRRMRQIDNIEKSYRKILFAAEEEAEEIRKVATQEAKKVLFETQQKSEMLLKQVNLKYEEKEKEFNELKEKEQLIQQELLKIADYIQETAVNSLHKNDYNNEQVKSSEQY